MCREQVLTINNARIWTALQGQGFPMVLCHGGPGGYDYLKPVADMVADLCQVLRYDQRGSGRSQVKGPYAVATFGDDLEALRKYFKFDSWIVGGHSWGAGLALAYAVRFPAHTKALVYISGTGIDSRWRTEYQKSRLAALNKEDREEFQRLYKMRYTTPGKELEGLQNRLRELSRKADVYDIARLHDIPSFQEYPTNDEVNRIVGADWDAYIADPPFRQAVDELEVPALFLHGAADPRPANLIEKLADRLVHGEFHVIQRAGHYPWIEQPDEFRALLRAFLTML